MFTLCNGYNSAVPKRHLVAKSEFAYSHFTQNSVVNVNWHIKQEKKKSKFDINNGQEALLKKKKRKGFLG